MSDRLSAFRNPSPFTLGIHSQKPPLQRYGAGIVMVLLVHAGAIVAIKSGLDIRGIFKVEPPLIATTIPVSPPIDKPKWNIEPKVTGATLTKPQEPTLPPIADDPPLDPPITNREPLKTIEASGGGDPVIAMARVDPRHPLTQPDYPSQSRKLGETGSVQLLVFVLPNGRVGDAQIAASSGFKRLDEAALREALRSWRFLPNTVDGVPTGSWNRIAISFRLKN